MSGQDAEISRIETERKRRELDRLLNEIKKKTERVPDSVINGDYKVAVDYKEVAKKGLSLLKSKRPTLNAAQKCAGLLSRFH